MSTLINYGDYSIAILSNTYETRACVLNLNPTLLGKFVTTWGHVYYRAPGLPIDLEHDYDGRYYVCTKYFSREYNGVVKLTIDNIVYYIKMGDVFMSLFRSHSINKEEMVNVVNSTSWLQFKEGDTISGARVLGYLAFDATALVRSLKREYVRAAREYMVYKDADGYYAFTEMPA